MDKMKKLLKRVSKRERDRLKASITQLILGNHKGLFIKKVKSKQCYRMRVGRFRIFFIFLNEGVEIIDIKLRNEKTYK